MYKEFKQHCAVFVVGAATVVAKVVAVVAVMRRATINQVAVAADANNFMRNFSQSGTAAKQSCTQTEEGRIGGSSILLPCLAPTEVCPSLNK